MPVQVREIRPLPLVGVPNGPQPWCNILYGLGIYLPIYVMSDFLVVESSSRALVLHIYLPPEIGRIIIANRLKTNAATVQPDTRLIDFRQYLRTFVSIIV